MSAQRIGFILGLAAFALTLILPAPEGMSQAAWRTTGIGLLMAFWWATEALPVPATSLIPIFAFPVFGVSSIGEATAPYASPLIFLFLGGFLIALSMERWNLHRRIALSIVAQVGSNPRMLVLGFMVATAGLSMWISNTATTMMMLPIGASVSAIMLMEADASGEGHDHSRFALCLMLGIAYAASVGGVGTLIGTPTNLAMSNILAGSFDTVIGFAEWMLLGLPFVLVMLPLTWLVLTRFVYPFELGPSEDAHQHVEEQRREMGRMTVPERRVAIIAGLVAFCWVSRGFVPDLVPGLSDTGIAIAGALLLFIVPAGAKDQDGLGGALMNWETTVRLPWGLILLFGGGLSLASAMAGSGLAEWISQSLAGVSAWPLFLLVGAIVAVVVYLTELTSN
ncbi:MAG: DASS family sodium-coupled anion symporter, partial [Alphaproteobacteria bacterium]|nr:DASS family sodium-coupled anion symporter [Alphaproteobacteria bacterium]